MEEFFVLKSLSDAGSWASLVGLVLTGATFYSLFNIKNRFVFRSHITTHQESLKSKSADITMLLVAYNDNKAQLDEYIKLADVVLRAMQKGASGEILSDIKNSRKLIQSYNKKSFFKKECVNKNEANAREIKTSLTVIVDQLDHVKNEIIIGSP